MTTDKAAFRVLCLVLADMRLRVDLARLMSWWPVVGACGLLRDLRLLDQSTHRHLRLVYCELVSLSIAWSLTWDVWLRWGGRIWRIFTSWYNWAWLVKLCVWCVQIRSLGHLSIWIGWCRLREEWLRLFSAVGCFNLLVEAMRLISRESFWLLRERGERFLYFKIVVHGKFALSFIF